MSRFRRFVANARFNAYGQVLQAALPFFFTPFILNHLGKEAYGLYALIGVVTAQLNLLSFGAGPATVKYLAEFDAAGDRSKVERLIGNSLVFYGATGLVGAGLLVAFAPLIGQRILRVSFALAPAVNFIFYCAAAGFLIQSVARTFHSVPQALHRFDLWNTMEALCSATLYGGTLWLLTHGFWLRSMAVWTAVVAGINLGLYVWSCRRLIARISLRPSYDSEMMDKVRSFGGWLFLGQISWSILFQADKIVLGHFIPMADLAYYLVSFNLSQKLFLLLNPVIPILLPFSSALFGKKEHDAARKFFLSGTKLTVILLWPTTILAFFFAPKFLDLWLKSGFGLNAGWPLRLLLFGTFMSALPLFGYSIAQGYGQVKSPSLVFAGHAAMGVLGWIVLMPRYGVLGGAIVFCVLETIYSAWLLAWCRGVVEVSYGQLTSALMRPFVLSLPVFLVAAIFRNSPKGWIDLGGMGIGSLGAYLILCFYLAFDNEERARVVEALRGKSVELS